MNTTTIKMKLNSPLLTGPLALAMFASAASAANVLVNGSFENTGTAITPDTANPAWGDTAAADGLTNWTLSATGALGLAAGDNFGGDAGSPGAPYFVGNTGSQLFGTDGDTFVSTTSGSGATILSQSISGLSAGTVNVSYDVGLITFGGNNLSIRFELFDGADATAASLYDVTTDVDATVANLNWSTITSGALSSTGTDLFVRITLDDPAGNSAQANLDNVIVDHVAVPEPSSAALLGLGGLALILRRRK